MAVEDDGAQRLCGEKSEEETGDGAAFAAVEGEFGFGVFIPAAEGGEQMTEDFDVVGGGDARKRNAATRHIVEQQPTDGEAFGSGERYLDVAGFQGLIC